MRALTVDLGRRRETVTSNFSLKVLVGTTRSGVSTRRSGRPVDPPVCGCTLDLVKQRLIPMQYGIDFTIFLPMDVETRCLGLSRFTFSSRVATFFEKFHFQRMYRKRCLIALNRNTPTLRCEVFAAEVRG